jgi:hypothetical protein
VQIGAIVIILLATHVPLIRGYLLPTVYITVFAFALLSGVHYIFHVSRLLGEDRQDRN